MRYARRCDLLSKRLSFRLNGVNTDSTMLWFAFKTIIFQVPEVFRKLARCCDLLSKRLSFRLITGIIGLKYVVICFQNDYLSGLRTLHRYKRMLWFAFKTIIFQEPCRLMRFSLSCDLLSKRLSFRDNIKPVQPAQLWFAFKTIIFQVFAI